MNEIILRAEITSLGGIVSNAQSILDDVLAAAETYKSDNYEPDEITAKNDKALLNRQLRDIKSARIDIERRYNKPLEEFLLTCKQIETVANETIKAVDEKTKQYEESRKRKKMARIEIMYPNNAPIALNKIFDNRWLNKTYDLDKVKADIDAKIAAIDENLKTIETVTSPENRNAVKTKYLDCLLLHEALAFGQKLTASMAAENDLKKSLLEREEKRDEFREYVKNSENAKAREVMSLVAEAMPEAAEKMYEYTFTARGSAAMFKALKTAILDNGGTYEKIDLSQYEYKF